jgi:hypothetical protein
MKTQNCKSTVGARLGSCTYEITYLGTFLEGLFEIDITAFADQSHSAVEARNLMLEIFVADHVVMDLIAVAAALAVIGSVTSIAAVAAVVVTAALD